MELKEQVGLYLDRNPTEIRVKVTLKIIQDVMESCFGKLEEHARFCVLIQAPSNTRGEFLELFLYTVALFHVNGGRAAKI